MRKYLTSAFWWAAFIVLSLLLESILFGPVFWALSVWSQPAATILAFVTAWSFGMWLVFSGTRSDPSGLAQFFLKRLLLEPTNDRFSSQEASVNRLARAGFLGAALVSPIIGGVVPSLLMHKYQLARITTIRWYAVILNAIFALEFAAIHGGYGIGGIAHNLF